MGSEIVSDRQRFMSVLKEAISSLCQNGLACPPVAKIDGLLGITLYDNDVFLINIHESFTSACSENDENEAECTTLTKPTYSVHLANKKPRVTTNGGISSIRRKSNHVQKKIPMTKVVDIVNSHCIQSKPRLTSITHDMIEPDWCSTGNTNEINKSDITKALQGRNLEGVTDAFNTSNNADISTADSHSNILSRAPANQKGLLKTRQLYKIADESVVNDNGSFVNYRNYTESYQSDSSILNNQNDTRNFTEIILLPNASEMLLQTVKTEFDSLDSEEFVSQIPKKFYRQNVYNTHNIREQTGCWTSSEQDITAVDEGKSHSYHQDDDSFGVATNETVLEPAVNTFHERKRIIIPRPRTRHYSAETLARCIDFVKNYKMSQREAEKVFDIPRTTIQVKMAKLYPNSVAPPRERNAFNRNKRK